MPPTDCRPSVSIERALKSDLESILALQKKAYVSEAEIYDDFTITPLLQSQADIEHEFEKMLFLKIETDSTIVGSVRAYEENGICHVGKLIVSPRHRNRGLGSALLLDMESRFPDVKAYELFTGSRSEKNLHIYTKHGYEITDSKPVSPSLTMVFLRKENPNA